MNEITRVINLQITHILSRRCDEIADDVEVNKDKDAAGVAEWLKEKLLADDVVVEDCKVFVMEVNDAGDNGDIPT